MYAYSLDCNYETANGDTVNTLLLVLEFAVLSYIFFFGVHIVFPILLKPLLNEHLTLASYLGASKQKNVSPFFVVFTCGNFFVFSVSNLTPVSY